ncbi:Hypothetical protein ZAZAV_397 [Cedratvirus Zaza IHUMI]|uniref:Uncharacterized protein n=1 Tax=Cedratvirus Zaza IHUMI TaxID=2126979 RepID=A0A2R8FF18_9VIRU|nr:Hypothetical protein ZAZAV_397 [Cedratvirus Zaza IHUMI]
MGKDHGKNKHHHKEKCCEIDQHLKKKLLKLWQEAFCDAAFVTTECGKKQDKHAKDVVVITHTDGTGIPLKINGLDSFSPLSNNALYSYECAPEHKKCDKKHARKHGLNLYETLLPDIPGKPGEKSTVEIYVKLLNKYGLDTAGVHFHWWGEYKFDIKRKHERVDRGIVAVHHQAVDVDPVEFSEKTICALKKTLKIIKKRIEECD